MSTVLELKELRFAFRGEEGQSLEILHGLSLRVQRGEMIAIQGPSGSGKSTLLNLIGGLLRPTSGSLKIAGVDTSGLDEEALALLRGAALGFVFQQFHLLPRATVEQNIALPMTFRQDRPQLRLSAEDLEKARGLARKLGLGDRLHHRPNQLSGGQQQRVAIARSMMNDPQLILADEPTGNLDSTNAAQTLTLLRDLNREGRTLLIVTHDPKVAAHCDRVIRILDGNIVEDRRNTPLSTAPGEAPLFVPNKTRKGPRARLQMLRMMLPGAWSDLKRNRARATLTATGVTIGIAAILSMLTLGRFVRTQLLQGYEALGVNKVIIRGHTNWNLTAKDNVSMMFKEFDMERDIKPLKQLFPDIALYSPAIMSWNDKADFGGVEISDVRQVGVMPEYLLITNRKAILGGTMTPYHVESSAPVCAIGYEIAEQLFRRTPPIGQMLHITGSSQSYYCKVISVLESQVSNHEWNKPNLQVLLPFTFLRSIFDEWQSRVDNVTLQLKSGADTERTGNAIKTYFERKYGKSGRFRVNSDAVLLAQMKRFLTLFEILIGGIAMISLAVGGIGITNMMLVSVSERLREIGLRKALGATPEMVRAQFLLETTLLCALGGGVGLLIGFATYQALIFAASKFMEKLSFAWVIDPFALIFSLSAILIVGLLSGLVPAIKAEKLQVVEALRSE